jgi:hypothetical protein
VQLLAFNMFETGRLQSAKRKARANPGSLGPVATTPTGKKRT